MTDTETKTNTLAACPPLTDVLERGFEAWWESEGQFCRAGGGQYEKTFAYHAWMASAEAERDACAKKCDEYANDYAAVGIAMYDRMETGARSCAAAIRERYNAEVRGCANAEQSTEN